MKLLVVTGCCGFIGQTFTRMALDLGYMIYGIDKMTEVSNDNAIYDFYDHKNGKNFTFVQEDIKDLTYLPDCDWVVNFAAESHVGTSIINSNEFMNSNVLGVQNLLELVRTKQSNVADRPVFVQISTDEVYGDLGEGFHTETDMLNPSNPYAASKSSADLLVLAWARTYGIKYNIMRPTNNYGKGQFPEKLIPLSVKNLRRGRKIKLHNEGEPIRTWLHIEDTVNAILTVMNKGEINNIYNISGGLEKKNIDTVKEIIYNYHGKDANWKDYVDFGCVRVGQDQRYALDDGKLRALGWEPYMNFDEQLKKIVEQEKETFRW
jgi:dTDP-glucose 4,6-dehydratase